MTMMTMTGPIESFARKSLEARYEAMSTQGRDSIAAAASRVAAWVQTDAEQLAKRVAWACAFNFLGPPDGRTPPSEADRPKRSCYLLHPFKTVEQSWDVLS